MSDRPIIDVVAIRTPDNTFTLTVDPSILEEIIKGFRKLLECKRNRSASFRRKRPEVPGKRGHPVLPSIRILESIPAESQEMSYLVVSDLSEWSQESQKSGIDTGSISDHCDRTSKFG